MRFHRGKLARQGVLSKEKSISRRLVCQVATANFSLCDVLGIKIADSQTSPDSNPSSFLFNMFVALSEYLCLLCLYVQLG